MNMSKQDARLTSCKNEWSSLTRDHIYATVRPRLYPGDRMPELRRLGILAVPWNGVVLTFWVPLDAGDDEEDIFPITKGHTDWFELGVDEMERLAIIHNREDFPIENETGGEMMEKAAG